MKKHDNSHPPQLAQFAEIKCLDIYNRHFWGGCFSVRQGKKSLHSRSYGIIF